MLLEFQALLNKDGEETNPQVHLLQGRRCASILM